MITPVTDPIVPGGRRKMSNKVEDKGGRNLFLAYMGSIRKVSVLMDELGKCLPIKIRAARCGVF